MATRAAARESLAMRIAERLLTADSANALPRARATRDRYLHAGNVVQADLFIAVCTIIGVWGTAVIRRGDKPEADQ